MNSDKYKDILANYLVPILSDSDSRAGRVFQQDLAPGHILKKMQIFFAQTGINPEIRLAREFSRVKPKQKSLGNNQNKSF